MTKGHINTFSKGMDKDTTPPKYPNTKYENANDLRLFTGDGLTTGAMVNIKGTDTLIDLPVLMKLSVNNPAINLNFFPGDITITAENGNTYTNTFTFPSTFEEFAEKLSAEGAFKAAAPFTVPSNSALPLSLVVHDTENNGIFVYSNEIQILVWNDSPNSSQNLINADNLKYFKLGSRLINLSRGGIVNSNDVIQALENGKLSKFVTDFPTPELIARSTKYSDVILLPHLGASTKEAEVNCAVMAANQLANFLQEGTIINSVNFPNVSQERSTPHRLIIINKNEPGMISKITDSIASLDLNIADMTNKSRNEIAINLIDLEHEASDELIKQLQSIDHVLKVRSINQAL